MYSTNPSFPTTHRPSPDALNQPFYPSTRKPRPGNTTLIEEEDVFRPVLKKKDFAAKITRTSKIMRLIEEAENIPPDEGALSGSLSRRSRERMNTITRVLGQKQPA